MNIYKKNLLFLKEHADNLAYSLEKTHVSSSAYQIIPTKEKNPSLQWKGKLLHSKYAPYKEAIQVMKVQLSQIQRQGNDALVFIGIGLGYYIQASYTLPNPDFFVIVEPDRELLKTCMITRDIQDILQHNYTILLAEKDPQQLIELLKQHHIRNPAIINISAIQQERQYRVFTEALRKYQSQQNINTNTLKRFGSLWVRNLLRNKEIIEHERSIEELSHAFSFTPALVCAAGPTLNTLLPHLKELVKRMLCISVDTVLPLLLKRGIDPDITVVIDPQYWNTRHLDALNTSNSIIIADTTTYPRVFRLLSGHLFLGGSLFPLGKLFDPPNRPVLGAGGSVVTTAWDLARLLGAKKIYFAGVDLSFPFSLSHAQGTFFEQLWKKESHRTKSIDTSLYEYLCSGDTLFVKNYLNEMVRSDRRMQLYQQWLQQKCTEKGAPITYTLSKQSAYIQAISHKNPVDCFELPLVREEIDKKKNYLLQKKKQSSTASQCSFTKLHHDFAYLQRRINEALDYVEFLKNKNSSLQEKNNYLARLAIIDQEFSQSQYKDCIGFLMPEAVQYIFQHLNVSDALQNSQVLYTACKQSIEYHIHLFHKYATF